MTRYVLIYVGVFLLAHLPLSALVGTFGLIAAMLLANVVVAWRYAFNQRRTMIESERFMYSLLSVVCSYLLMAFLSALVLFGVYLFLSAADQAAIREMVDLFWQALRTEQWRDTLAQHQTEVLIVAGSLLILFIIHFATIYLSFNPLVRMFINRQNIANRH